MIDITANTLNRGKLSQNLFISFKTRTDCPKERSNRQQTDKTGKGNGKQISTQRGRKRTREEI